MLQSLGGPLHGLLSAPMTAAGEALSLTRRAQVAGDMSALARALTYGTELMAPPSRDAADASLQPRLRRKIWDLPSGWHCALVGTCLTVSDLRQLMRHGVGKADDVGDYGLHSYVVNHCSSRNGITKEMQRILNQRHAQQLRRFARLRNSTAVLEAWRAELSDGNIAAALWAAWTHGDLEEYEGSLIYGDVHMLSHQACAHGKPSQLRVAELEQALAREESAQAQLRHELTVMRNQRAQRIVELETRLAQLEGQLAACRQHEAGLAEVYALRQHNQALQERNALLSERLAAVEQRNQSLQQSLQALDNELARCRNAAQRKNDAGIEGVPVAVAQACAVAVGASAEAAGGAQLGGRRVLCVGGRPGMIERYRQLVEDSGGSFVHHGGAQEANDHRIDAILAGADVVLCQVGYVSHLTYWRVKEACKQRGLPCVFQKTAGITAFARDLAMIAEAAPLAADYGSRWLSATTEGYAS